MQPNGDADLTKSFLRTIVELLLQYIEETFDRDSKVLHFKHPIKMLQEFDFSLPQQPLPLARIVNDCRQTLVNQVRTGHPHFFNQLSSGLDIVSLAGDWLTSACNSNMFTYEIAPTFVLMEAETLRHMRELIGWPGDGAGDGIFAPGGSMSNLYALNAARHKKFPQVKLKGLSYVPTTLVLFTSEHGAAAICGIGTNNVIEVRVDERGKMMPCELEKEVLASIERGEMPFFVNATAGTTVLGAFDPLDCIADVCDKYDMWMHVDGAWGAGVLLGGDERRALMSGVGRADSVTWNPHKLMGGLLFSCNQMCADYLFQQDKHYNVEYDTGDRAIQCGRHVDIFKLWLMWRAMGDDGFRERIEHLFDMRDYLLQRIRARDDFWLVIDEPECTNVSFWYIPPSLREMRHGPKMLDKLGKITPVIKARMMDKGTMMIGYQPLGAKPNFFRVVVSNAAVTRDDIDFMIDEIERIAKDL